MSSAVSSWPRPVVQLARQAAALLGDGERLDTVGVGLKLAMRLAQFGEQALALPAGGVRCRPDIGERAKKDVAAHKRQRCQQTLGPACLIKERQRRDEGKEADPQVPLTRGQHAHAYRTEHKKEDGEKLPVHGRRHDQQRNEQRLHGEQEMHGARAQREPEQHSQ